MAVYFINARFIEDFFKEFDNKLIHTWSCCLSKGDVRFIGFPLDRDATVFVTENDCIFIEQ